MVRVEQLMGEYNYFSLMEMKVRDPFLYQQVIERAAGCGGGGGCYRTMDLTRRFPPQCTPSQAQLDTMSEVERMVWLLLVGEASVAAAQFRECARRERKVLRYWGELECVEEGLEAVPTPVSHGTYAPKAPKVSKNRSCHLRHINSSAYNLLLH